jgi:hypothetical protein
MISSSLSVADITIGTPTKKLRTIASVKMIDNNFLNFAIEKRPPKIMFCRIFSE